ncbi:MAG: sterol desaturase family protein, partial [Candidatus Sedimenticola sp. (ex Thyasira tokunagai)]
MELNRLILDNEVVIRLAFFFGVFAVIAIWELASPCRKLTVPKALRWGNNLLLVFLNSTILRLLF